MKNWIMVLLPIVLFFSCDRKKPQLDHWRTISQYDSLGRIELDEDRTKWTEIKPIDGQLEIDLVYATSDHFLNRPLYQCSRCFLTRETAEVFYEYVDAINRRGYRVRVLDCYRPRRVQHILYDAYPDGNYFRDPMQGAMHNRGLAVDITLLDKNGNEVDMGTDYNHFGPESYHDNFDVSKQALEHRKVLRSIGRPMGFQAVRSRWWQYNYRHTTALSNDFIWTCKD